MRPPNCRLKALPIFQEFMQNFLLGSELTFLHFCCRRLTLNDVDTDDDVTAIIDLNSFHIFSKVRKSFKDHGL
jgi:hypothetical protein